MKSWVLTFMAAGLLAGCATSPSSSTSRSPSSAGRSYQSSASYVVEKGDTLWSISRRMGITVDDLRRSNPDAGTLEVGQVLILPGVGPESLPAVDDGPAPSAEAAFIRPVRNGRVLQHGADRDLIVPASFGDDIVAVKSGKVSFTGPVPGYGQVVMVKHSDDHVSFYGNASFILVVQGQNVRQGQAIARVGNAPANGSPRLIFKLHRRDGFVDPSLYIR